MRRFKNPEKNPKKTLLIVLIGGSLMIVYDFISTQIDKNAASQNSALVEIEQGMKAFELDNSEIKDFKSAQDVVDKMNPAGVKLPERAQDESVIGPSLPPKEDFRNQTPGEGPGADQKPLQNWKKNAVKLKAPPQGAEIVIIIDDMGMDRGRSQEVIDMTSAPLTLAFLPYAPALKEITARARDHGHELLIHAPMEPLNKDLDPGPIAILSDMDGKAVERTLDKMFTSFDGYVGINNHMGSEVTQERPILNHVMEALAERDLIFVDSKTINQSIAAKVAAEHGLDYAERDVFLDHDETPGFVSGALAKLEHIASERGYAVAIGHPKDVTINALKEWLPDVQARGFTIVPVSAIVHHEQSERLLVSQPRRPEASLSSESQTLQ